MHSKNHYDELGDYARDLIKNKALQIIGKAGFKASDLDDIEQELALDLIVRLRKYDPSRARQTTFMSRIIDHKISSLLSERYAQCRDWRLCTTSLNENAGESLEPNDEQLEALVAARTSGSDDALDLMVDLQEALASFPDDMRELWERLLKGKVSQVANDLGVSRTTPYGRMKKLRVLFAKAGLDAYLA